MPNCPDCGCPAENHLVGLGCTTIIGYEGKVQTIEIAQSFFDFSEAEKKPSGPPILCGCRREGIE